MTRYMLIMRVAPEAEARMAELEIDFNQVIASMSRFNQELVKAGVLLAGEGLTGPEEGFVVDFVATRRSSRTARTPRPRSCSTGSGSSMCRQRRRPSSGPARAPLGPGVKLEVRRVSEIAEFPTDNPWVQKEIQWRADIADKVAATARKAAGR